jgi:hypothetical protein
MQHPSIQESAAAIQGKAEIYNKLAAMIEADTRDREAFAVGANRIGEYWERGGEWSSNRDDKRKLSLDEVLKEASLSMDRYREYLDLFEKLGARKIRFLRKNKNVDIILSATGISVSGCVTTLERNADGDIPKQDIQPGYSIEILEVGEGWFVRKDCT